MPDPIEITLGNITEVIVEVGSTVVLTGNGTGNGTTTTPSSSTSSVKAAPK